jgi:hypothetical protein
MNKLRMAVAIAGVIGATSAVAAPVSSAVDAGTVLFSDNSAEYMIDRNNNGTLDVGDSLRGILSIDNITGSGPQVAIGTGTIYNELTGIFQVEVLSKVAVGGGRYNYTFGFDATFGQGAGVVGVLFDDAAQDFARSNCGGTNSFADCEATATGGSLWATLGLGADGFWSAVGAVETPASGGNLPLATPLGSFSMGMEFITNNTGFSWNKVQCVDLTDFSLHAVDVCGQGGLLASGRNVQGGANTPYDIFDNVDFTANRVPEPGSLALVAAALVGFGAMRRGKK